MQLKWLMTRYLGTLYMELLITTTIPLIGIDKWYNRYTSMYIRICNIPIDLSLSLHLSLYTYACAYILVKSLVPNVYSKPAYYAYCPLSPIAYCLCHCYCILPISYCHRLLIPFVILPIACCILEVGGLRPTGKSFRFVRVCPHSCT